jgi:SPP1 gp7 family putative phage head morphogenesis protein
VQATASTVNKPAKADSVLERILSYVRTAVGSRVTSINRTTREKIQAAVAEGIEKGMSPAELGKVLETSAAFDEYRAEMIARTETAYAYNDSAIGSYRDLGVEQVEVIDGDMDATCSTVNGATWSMDEARSNPIGHPNCTRDFIPVVAKAAKAAVSQEEGIHIHIPAPQVTVNVPDFPKIPAPVINLPAPIVNVPEQPAPIINLPATPAAKASLPQEVRVVSMPNRVHRALRDNSGNIAGSLEEDD